MAGGKGTMAKQGTSYETIDPRKLKPDPNNPRKTWDQEAMEHQEGISQSLEALGQIQDVVIDENDIIRMGHVRVRAAIQQGLSAIRVKRRSGLTEQEWLLEQLADDALRLKLTGEDFGWSVMRAVFQRRTGKTASLDQVMKIVQKDPGLLAHLRNDSGELREIATTTGISMNTILRSLVVLERLLLSGHADAIREKLRSGEVSTRQLTEAHLVGDEALVEKLEQAIVEEKLPTYRKVEKAVKAIKAVRGSSKVLADAIAEAKVEVEPEQAEILAQAPKVAEKVARGGLGVDEGVDLAQDLAQIPKDTQEELVEAYIEQREAHERAVRAELEHLEEVARGEAPPPVTFSAPERKFIDLYQRVCEKVVTTLLARHVQARPEAVRRECIRWMMQAYEHLGRQLNTLGGVKIIEQGTKK